MRGLKQGVMVMAGQESRDWFDVISDIRDSLYLFVSDSGSRYCQIQTTRLIMFFETVIKITFVY